MITSSKHFPRLFKNDTRFLFAYAQSKDYLVKPPGQIRWGRIEIESDTKLKFFEKSNTQLPRIYAPTAINPKTTNPSLRSRNSTTNPNPSYRNPILPTTMTGKGINFTRTITDCRSKRYLCDVRGRRSAQAFVLPFRLFTFVPLNQPAQSIPPMPSRAEPSRSFLNFITYLI